LQHRGALASLVASVKESAWSFRTWRSGREKRELPPPSGALAPHLYQDGLGTRWLGIDPESSEPIEILAFSPDFVQAPEFAAAVGERVARLARVRHTLYARARRLDRPSEDSLLLVSSHVAGWRLADVLGVIEREQLTLDISAILALMRQLIPAVALFSRHQRDAAIGTIGPERLVLTPQGRLVVAEYVLAPGLERLQYSRERLWRDLRIVLPHTASPTRIPPSADVVGMAVVALSLLIGRLLKEDEYLWSLGDLVESAMETSGETTKKLSASFRYWIARALQFDEQTGFQSPQEAQVAFEEMLAKEREYVTNPAQLDLFLLRLEKIVGPPREAVAPEPVPVVPPPVVAAPPAVVAAPAVAAPVAAVAAVETPSVADQELVTVAVTPPAEELHSRVSAPEPEPAVASRAETREDSKPRSKKARVAPKPIVPIETPAPAPAPAAAAVEVAQPVIATSAGERLRRFALPVLMAVIVAEAAFIGWLLTRDAAPMLTGQGELVIQSRPVAARVTIDGDDRGVTPLTVQLDPGAHILEVRVGRSEPRVIPLSIRAGVQSGLYVELQSVATVGALDIRTEPSKAKITINGQYRGTTPMVLRDLPPGNHEVLLEAGSQQIRQTVRIEPGITSQLVVPMGQ
jgi:PEGA domain